MATIVSHDSLWQTWLVSISQATATITRTQNDQTVTLIAETIGHGDTTVQTRVHSVTTTAGDIEVQCACSRNAPSAGCQAANRP